MKKLLALFLAFVFVIALVGCGGSKREPIQLTLSTEDAAAIMAAAGINLPDISEAVGANQTITYFYYYDDFHNYSEDEIVQTGYWTFQNKYNGNVEWIETTWETLRTDLAQLVLTNNSPDFTKAWESEFPTSFINQLYAPVDDYIDYDDPLWGDMKHFSETYFSIGGHHYMFLTDIQNNSLVLYNRRVFTEYGFDDPAELYYNDQWTWDVMYEMCADFCDPDDGRYAFNGWHTDDSFLSSTGIYLVELDTETGKFISKIDDPRIERAVSVLADFSKNDFYYPIWNDWTPYYGNEHGGMKEGMVLFGLAPAYSLDEIVSYEDGAAIYGDFETEVMICPVPRDPNGDGEYYVDAIPKGYLLVKGAEHPEAVALLAACERFKIMDPTVIRVDERQKIEKLHWTDEMLDMWNNLYDIAHSHNTLVQYSNLGNVSGYVGNLVGFDNLESPSTWAELKEANKDALQAALDELNAQLASELES